VFEQGGDHLQYVTCGTEHEHEAQQAHDQCQAPVWVVAGSPNAAHQGRRASREGYRPCCDREAHSELEQRYAKTHVQAFARPSAPSRCNSSTTGQRASSATS
jgi:hypothetical protein